MPSAPPIVTAGRAIAGAAHHKAGANDNNKGELKYRISWVTGGFMLALSAVLDTVQVFLTLTVFLALGTYMVDFLYMTIFGVWLYILRVPLFGGRHSGLKLASIGSGIIVELVPVFNALPAMTASVLGVIIAQRMEDRMKHASREKSPVKRPTQLLARTIKLPRAANYNARRAANDDESSVQEAA